MELPMDIEVHDHHLVQRVRLKVRVGFYPIWQGDKIDDTFRFLSEQYEEGEEDVIFGFVQEAEYHTISFGKLDDVSLV